jgi:hypothetical protein
MTLFHPTMLTPYMYLVRACWHDPVEGPPRIVRLFCKGRVFERASPEFDELLPEGDERAMPGTRAIIWLDIHKGQ